MRQGTKDEIRAVVLSVVRNEPGYHQLMEVVQHDVRMLLGQMVGAQAGAVVPGMARAAVAEAAPDRLAMERRIESAVGNRTFRTLRAQLSETLPELAATAVAEAAPDRAELEAQAAARATAAAQDAVHTATARAVEQVVGRAVAQVVEACTADLTRFADGRIKTVADLVEAADDRLTSAEGRAVASIEQAVERRLDQLIDDFVPDVVHITLPSGQEIRLGADTHAVLPDLLTALNARCHVLLVGPAGTGKSMLAKQAAEALGLQFQALSLGPTTPMSKVFGYYDAHGNYHDTPFRQAFEHGGVMLLDELDNGHPGLLAELNQALALGVCAFADGMIEAHPDFRLVATGNTYGTGADRHYVGRQTLDAATLDRFVVIDVPIDEKLEERIALRHAPKHQAEVHRLLERVRDLRATATDKQLPVVFSPRASIDGAKLIAAGATNAQVLRWRVVRGLSSAHCAALGLDPDELGE